MKRSIFFQAFCLILALGLTITTFAQDKQHTENNADQTLRSSGRVNPSTFALEMDIPLGSYPGSGISVPVSISYSSKVWRMNFSNNEPVSPGCTAIWDPKFGEDSASGWTSSMGTPYIEYTGADNIYDGTYGHPISDPCNLQAPPIEQYGYIKRIQVHLPSGESHELRSSDYPVRYDPTDLNYVKDMSGIYYSTDGSKLKYEENATTKRLYLPNGSYYDFAVGKTTLNQKTIRKGILYKDINGNQLTYYEGNSTYPNGYWMDTLNRPIPVPMPVKEMTTPGIVDYVMPGFNNGTMTYKFHWKQLQGTTAVDSGLTVFNQSLLHKGDFYALNSPYRDASEALFHSEYRNRARSLSSDPVFNPVVLTAVELPNGQKYEFSYNIYGEIEHIKYPTGSEEFFQFWKVPAVGAFDSNTPNKEANRGVKQRDVYESSGVTPYTWTYSSGASLAGNNMMRVVTAPDGTKTQRDLYMGIPPPGGEFGSWGFNNVLVGMAYEERTYASSGLILSNTKTTWEKTEVQTTGTSVKPQRHPRVTKVENIVYDLSGSALSNTTTMDYAGNLTDIDNHLDVNLTKQYGYTTSLGSLGTLEKQIETVFMEHDSSFPNWSNYENLHLIGLPTKTFTRNGAGTIVAKSEIKYDETNYGNGFRGQPTSVRNWLDTNDSWITTRAKYDTYGNVIQTTDANGKVSTTTYDAVNHAYPIGTTSPVPGNGTNGSNAAFSTAATFDPVSGLTLTKTDVNGQTTTLSYTDPVSGILDPLLRLRKVTAPNGHQTIIEYGNGTSPETRYVKTKTQIDNQKWKESYSWFDGLGRTIKTENKDAQGDVITEIEYDIMGRIKRKTNPFREGIPDNEKLWTQTLYDDSGSEKEVTTPDGAKFISAYSLATTGDSIGQVLTTTDQAGKKRRSITNSSGNLIRVDEPDDSNNLGDINAPTRPTYNSYDVLGNTTQITQGQQTRTFQYDSLGRLKQSTNPESGTVLQKYDANSNLIEVKDARNITTTIGYDALNRVIAKDFSDTTPDITFSYDATTAANSKGKLTRVDNGISVTETTGFDSTGNILSSRQIIDGQTYSMSYGYNLAGILVEETYPSTRVVKNVLDQDGDLSIVESKANTNAISKTYANGFAFTPSGGISTVKLGNGKWESFSFNERLQLSGVSLGNSQGGTELLKIDYNYGGTDNNGNLKSQTVTVPTVGSATGFVAVQDYTYDSLNRLTTATEKTNNTQTWKQSFSYDRYGNRRFIESGSTTLPAGCAPQCNPQFDTNNQISINQGYEYDASGKITKNANNQKFTYNAENKITEIRTATTNALIGTYIYDGNGQRVKKIFGNETTIFVYDTNGKMVAEYTINIAATQNPATNYLTSDNLGTPRVITNQLGQVTARRDFMPFGEELYAGAGSRTTNQGYVYGSISNKFGGQIRDEEAKLDYFNARSYDYNLGRFSSADNFGGNLANPQTLNLYAYVLNNPLKWIDPSGHMAEKPGGDGDCGTVDNPCEDPTPVSMPTQRGCERDKTCITRGSDLPDSWNDYAPVYGNFRRAIWNYKSDGGANVGRFLGYMGLTAFELTGVGATAKGLNAAVKAVPRVLSREALTETLSSGRNVWNATKQAVRNAFGGADEAASAANCFVRGTLVTTATGLVAIEEIRAGDKVLSYDEDIGQLEYQEVVRLFRNTADVFLKIQIEGEAKPIIVTLGHPFYVNRTRNNLSANADDDQADWVLSKSLKVGDLLRLTTGEWKPIRSIERVAEAQTTYNFEVAKNHNYFVGQKGWLVHNQSLATRARFEVGPNGAAIPTSKTELTNSLQNAGFNSYPNTRTAETGINFVNPNNGHIYRIMDGSSVNPTRLITHPGAGQGPITPYGASIPPGLKGNAVRDVTHFLLGP